MFHNQLLMALGLACLIAVPAKAATIVGPSPYLSLADTPDGVFPEDGTPYFQDFEDDDGPWLIGFSIEGGERIGPEHTSGAGVPVTDSVDDDDDAIDGDGTLGASWFTSSRQLTFTFEEPAASAGFAFTDADILATQVLIEAFGVDDELLVSQTYDASFFDDVYTGTTQEDRFFGVVAMGSERLTRITVAIDDGAGIEIDHVQFVKSVPEPSALLLLLASLCSWAGVNARRRSRRQQT